MLLKFFMLPIGVPGLLPFRGLTEPPFFRLPIGITGRFAMPPPLDGFEVPPTIGALLSFVTAFFNLAPDRMSLRRAFRSVPLLFDGLMLKDGGGGAAGAIGGGGGGGAGIFYLKSRLVYLNESYAYFLDEFTRKLLKF